MSDDDRRTPDLEEAQHQGANHPQKAGTGKTKGAKPTREERLAEALRANLRRRKAAAKERAS